MALVLEGVARIRERIYYGSFSRAGTPLYVPQPDGKPRLTPNADVDGGDMKVHVSSLGFRGHDVVVPKPAGVRRIVCIGGSTTFDILAKSDAATWPAQLEQRLRAGGHPEVEVVNAGVAGYTVDSYLDDPELWQRIASVSPDVVVGYFATNEIAEEARHRFEAKWLHCPHGDFEQPKEVAPDLAQCPRCGASLELHDQSTPPLLERAAKTITDWSLFAYKVHLAVELLRKPPEIEGRHELPPEAALAFERKLRELTHRIRGLDARPVLATFAVRWRADQPLEEQRRLAAGAFPIYVGLSLDGIDRALADYNAAIGRVAATEGCATVPIAETLAGDPTLFGDFVHFSEAGSTRMAEAMAKGLEGSGVLGRR